MTGPDGRAFVIAEAGVNHNGDVEMALELVERAAESGADAVKFQTFRARDIASRSAAKADYQRRTTNADESQLAMLERLELAPAAFERIADRCEARGIAFLSTPFDLGSVDLLLELGVERFKLGSGDLTNAPLLRALGRSGRASILSTGMATLGEIEAALGIFAAAALEEREGRFDPAVAHACDEGWALLSERVTLLHCTSEYPAPPEDVNLRAMDTLRNAFGLPVGFSDHTEGSAIAVAAVARGARVLEKHFTLDRTLPGPDHAASLEPEELSGMVRAVRAVERALGSGRKRPAPAEVATAAAARKSLVAARPIRVGEAFTEGNLTTKRPGSGISALRYYDWIGRTARRDYETDDLIEE